MNGLIAELNMIIVEAVAYVTSPKVWLGAKKPRKKVVESVSQETPKMTLTRITIKVTRFRTFITPYEMK